MNNLSIVIVNYNSGFYLKDCVLSCLGQARKIIVVDNASSDASLDFKLVDVESDRLAIIKNDANRGFASACNIGYRHATTPNVLFLNPDCQLDSHSAEILSLVLDTNPKCGMVGGLLIGPDGLEQRGARRTIPSPWQAISHSIGLTRFRKRLTCVPEDFYLHKQPLPSVPIEVDAVSGACLMVKREAVGDVGLWDDAYFLHCEDLDWCMRFKKNSWKILFVPTAKVFHQSGVSSRNRPFFVEWHKHQGIIRFYKKFYRNTNPAPLLWLVIFGSAIRFALVSIFLYAKLLYGKSN